MMSIVLNVFGMIIAFGCNLEAIFDEANRPAWMIATGVWWILFNMERDSS